MRNFILGIMFTFVAAIAVVAIVVTFGYFPTPADGVPPDFERRIAMRAVDASMERNAPRINNPLPATDDNLMAGLKLYNENCSGCHGTFDKQPSVLEKSLYPPIPQLILDPPDDPEWHIFYAIRTGIRYTGMPAWNKVLKDTEMWQIASFLSHLEKLPPAVEAYGKSVAATPASATPNLKKGEGDERQDKTVPPSSKSPKSMKRNM